MPLGFLIPSFQPRIQAPSPASFPHSAHLLSLIPRPSSQPHSQTLSQAPFPGSFSSLIPRPSPYSHFSQAAFPGSFSSLIPRPSPYSHFLYPHPHTLLHTLPHAAVPKISGGAVGIGPVRVSSTSAAPRAPRMGFITPGYSLEEERSHR